MGVGWWDVWCSNHMSLFKSIDRQKENSNTTPPLDLQFDKRQIITVFLLLTKLLYIKDTFVRSYPSEITSIFNFLLIHELNKLKIT